MTGGPVSVVSSGLRSVEYQHIIKEIFETNFVVGRQAQNFMLKSWLASLFSATSATGNMKFWS